jgi:hypothetical protein
VVSEPDPSAIPRNEVAEVVARLKVHLTMMGAERRLFVRLPSREEAFQVSAALTSEERARVDFGWPGGPALTRR